jgi:type IV pilus assembly protein PilC
MASLSNIKLPAFFSRVSVKDRAFLSRQLATMLSSGIPLIESVKVLMLQTKNTIVLESLTQIAADLESGLTFSAAIERHPKLFNKIYVSIVRSGEATGKLEDVLLQLADNIEKESALVGKLKSAMVYPIFIITAMIGVAILMMVKVMPQLQSIFTESNVELPITTKILLAMSGFMVNFWWLVVIALVGGAIGLAAYFRTPDGSAILNHIVVKIPGGIANDLYMARFTRTMSMLVKAGLPIIQALEITSQVMNNVIYGDALMAAKTEIERGLPLSAPLAKHDFFPKIVTQMVMVGEQTGRLDQILERLAAYYETELDDKVKGISSLIEPVIIVILGVGVAFLVMAVLMPIYNITQIQ